MTLSNIIEQLSCSTFYPHPVEVITTIETHISIVFLTGEFAYKLKKPVNFGFLDFSSIEKRKHFCQLEVSLNRRTAPHLYLDVLPVYQYNGQLTLNKRSALDPQAQNPVDYLIKMQQFDPNKVLGRYLIDQHLNQTQVNLLITNLTQLHDQAQVADSKTIYGTPQSVLQPMLDNFAPLMQSFTHPEARYRLQQLIDWTKFTHKQLHEQLIARKQNGYIRACHGDLHLDNITLINEQPMLFDGIEFNEQFRWIDTLSDLAFFAIDCDYRQQIALRRQVINGYFNHTGDYASMTLFNFYQVYRAMVRAKITLLRHHQLPATHPDHAESWQRCLDYFTQAQNYAYGNHQPQIVLMQGVSGSGKSYYAKQMLNHMDAIILSSDIERKRLFNFAPNQRPTEIQRNALYSPSMSAKTYETLLQQSRQLLQSGYSVIVDATFLKQTHRLPFQQLANQLKCGYKVASIQFNYDLVQQNLQQREQDFANPSDATLDIMHLQTKQLEPILANEPHLIISPKSTLDTQTLLNFLFN